jgi:hypothetical protein
MDQSHRRRLVNDHVIGMSILRRKIWREKNGGKKMAQNFQRSKVWKNTLFVLSFNYLC